MNENLKNAFKKEIKEITDLGYNDINIKNIEANLENNFHSHEFDAYALVIKGQFIVNDQKKEYILNPGDKIEVKAKQIHSEKTRDNGAKILIGKKNL